MSSKFFLVIIFSLAILCEQSSVLAQSQTCSTVFNNTDFKANNIDIGVSFSFSLNDCCGRCNSIFQCKAFTYVPTVQGGVCYLKNGVLEQSKWTISTGSKENYLSFWFFVLIFIVYLKKEISGLRSGSQPSPTQYDCFTKKNINFAQNDILISPSRLNSEQDCCNACGSRPNCVGFVYKENFCWLKSLLRNKQKTDGFTSGIVYRA